MNLKQSTIIVQIYTNFFSIERLWRRLRNYFYLSGCTYHMMLNVFSSVEVSLLLFFKNCFNYNYLHFPTFQLLVLRFWTAIFDNVVWVVRSNSCRIIVKTYQICNVEYGADNLMLKWNRLKVWLHLMCLIFVKYISCNCIR